MAQKISQMTAVVAIAGTEIVEVSQLSATVTITASTISAAAADNSYNDSGNGLGIFAVEDTVAVFGFTGNVLNNINSGTVETVAAGKITIRSPEGDVIVDDAAGESVTITRWDTRRMTLSAFVAWITALQDIDIQKTFRTSGTVTPAQINNTQNNYNPTGLDSAVVLRLSSDETRYITGIAGGVEGRILVLHNVDEFDIVLKNEDAGSTDVNRFALGADELTLRENGSIMLQYDATTDRWRALGSSGGSVYTRLAAWSKNGIPIVAGEANVVYRYCRAKGKITKAIVLTDGGPGDLEIDVWKAEISDHYPPVIGDSITAAAPLAMSSSDYLVETTFSGWDINVDVGDVIGLKLVDSTNFTFISAELEITT